jgi:hypothetical protein
MSEPVANGGAGPDDQAEQVDQGLQRTLIAILAGWLVPGAGHAVLGRVRRGIFFGVLLWGSFAFGMLHEGRLSLRDNKQPLLTGLQVVANLGMGPVDPVARMFVYGTPVYSMTGGPDPVETVEAFRVRERSPLSIYGTAYIWTAGLMNFLLLFDLWDIGRGRSWHA